jgi:hypothetical protein
LKTSKQIEGFLDFLREAKTDYNIAVSSEKEANDATQDLLHSLELYENTYHEYARAAKKLAQVRQERREAKDRREQIQPVMDWLEENGKVVFGLEKLLGDVRKAEKAAEGRFYTQRTDVLVEIGKAEAVE